MQNEQPPYYNNVRGKRPRFRAFRSIIALILREMSSRYGRTPGGYIWAVLEPMAAILFLSIGFSLLIRAPSLGTSFLLFYATGYLPMHTFLSLSSPISQSIKFSKTLLKFPAVNWMDAILARFLLNSLTNVMINFILFTLILSFVESQTVLDLIPIIQAFCLAMLLGLGIGVLNCAIIGLFPVWGIAWSIITRPLFLASGVIFLYEDLPTFAQDILWYNPIMHITGLMRTGFYVTYTPNYIDFTFVSLTGMILLTLGLILTGRYHRDILNS